MESVVVHGLIKGVAAGLAVSAGVVIVGSQFVAPVELSEIDPAPGTRSETADVPQSAGSEEIGNPETDDSDEAEETNEVNTPVTETSAPAQDEPADTVAAEDTFDGTPEVDATETVDAPEEPQPDPVKLENPNPDSTTAPDLAAPTASDPPSRNDLSDAPEADADTPDLEIAATEQPATPEPLEIPQPRRIEAPEDLSAPRDSAAPALPTADADGTSVAPLAEGPIAPAADTAPQAGDAPVATAAAPQTELNAPDLSSRDLAAVAPGLDDPVLPVPESRRPSLPAPTDVPTQTDAPAAAQVTEAEAEESDVPSENEVEAVTIDDIEAGQETAPDIPPVVVDEGIAGPGAQETALNRRDSVRVNRLAQIEPPAPQPEPAEETDALDDPETDETETPVADEDGFVGETSETTETDAGESEPTSTRPSSNLIERRLRAIEAERSPAPVGEVSELTAPDGTSRDVLAALPDRAVEAPATDRTDDDADVASGRDTELTGVAIDDFAAPFDNPAGLPLVSVVLLDYGGPTIDIPVAISVALDASQPDVAARADLYRDRGYDVLVIPELPRGGAAQDIEQALQASLRAVEGAVAVIPDPSDDLQSDRIATETLIGRLAETGHGLVSFPGGLNRARQVATRAEVPNGVVLREIDAAGQDLRAVKRFLDQAAFQARQENAVILVGRNRPETRGALMEWRLGNRAEGVSLAPISAALRELSR